MLLALLCGATLWATITVVHCRLVASVYNRRWVLVIINTDYSKLVGYAIG